MHYFMIIIEKRQLSIASGTVCKLQTTKIVSYQHKPEEHVIPSRIMNVIQSIT